MLSLFHIFRIHCTLTFALATVLVFVARVGFGVNKYTIWALYVFVPIGLAHFTEGNTELLTGAIDAARNNIQPLLF